MLLEVRIESQNFPIVLEPRWLYPGYVIIFWCISLFLEGGVVETFGQLIDEVFVDGLFMELSLLLLGSIYEIELLCLVEALLVRIVEDVTREEGDLFRNVCLH
jgi:hypothetical protein